MTNRERILGGYATLYMINDVAWVVTTGTGERSYGRTGGTMCFAYDADDVEALSTDDVVTYQDFCDAIEPETDRDLAIVLAAEYQLRLTVAGACTPVLSDDEYNLIRRVVEVVS